ncbi:chemotaxis protein CheA [Oleiagrimonas sp. C23AA]|uniref:chemotaxis protein CheA n=1 Tax=Oleiagrimonas sp. C23AA TaxID=2719047 RepID=UPI0014222149|nr:chemotaxis protein CheA [Oleiagrimonas sp. C23AA]NII09226.1 chemotaxis protein CheA [Oleiagrimonas sp. C23AA]
MSAVDLAQFHQVFFEESLEGLQAMESALLELDSGSDDPELVHTIFRAAHSIKGGSSTFGFSDVAAFTHVAESLLEEVRSGRRAVDAQITDLLLRSVDCLRLMLARSRDGEPAADAESEEIRQALAVLVGQDTGGAAKPAKAAAPAVPAIAGWHIDFKPLPHLFKTGNDPVRLFRELASLGEAFKVEQVFPLDDALPSLDACDPTQCHLGWKLRLDGDVARKQIDAVFDWLDGDAEITLTEIKAETTPESASSEPAKPSADTAPTAKDAAGEQGSGAAAPRSAGASSGDGGSIRVSIPKIDALINMVGELVITQSMLSEMGERFEDAAFEKLRDGLSQLERNTRELQESVMSIRMLPIGAAFNRFPRLVRDLERKLGKRVNLEMHGEHTELDKTVMEKIGDPLVHLVRNAIDHGLESPEERKAAGKHEVGTISLNAYHEGGNIVVEVKDDGKGLNRDAIASKAVERGLIRSAQGLSDDEVAELIFQPGFSTAAQTTDLSGRGVGMDVVRRNVNDLGGSVRVRSVHGEGSTFTIVLPLTLAIIDGLATAVGGERYIVPLTSIVESMQLKATDVRQLAGGGELFRFRDNYMPLVRLHKVFECEHAVTEVEKGIVVVVEGEGRQVGLFADELLGQQQAVVKSLEAHYRRIEGISGATILGDGSVALIVDITGVVRVSQQAHKAA